jgi:hypothetical protein
VVRRADIELFLARNDEATALALNRRREGEEQLRKEPVTPGEILRQLSGEDLWFRQGALVRLIARGNPTEEEALLVASGYSVSAPFLERYYATKVLALSRDNVVGKYSTTIADALMRETNDSIRATALVVVPKLEGIDGVRVSAEYIRTGSPSLALSAYAVAWDIGPAFACAVRTEVVRLGRGNGLEVIQAIETLGGPFVPRPDARCPMGRRQEELRPDGHVSLHAGTAAQGQP